MERYTEYKDSGVKWLGEIPSHWKTVPLKSIVSCNDDTWSESTPKDTLLNYVEISDVSLIEGIKKITQVKFADAPSRARRKTIVGDVIISTVRTYLQAIAQITKKDITVSTGFAVLRPKMVNNSFIHYYMASTGFISDVIANSKGTSYPAINASELIHLKVVLPPHSEQQAIANYLDAATSKIDEAIAQQQNMIDLLNERKQIIINNTVTKGLNPNVPMKDSGVDWIGKIPEHWEIKRGKFLFVIINEYSSTGEEELLTVSDRTGITPRSMKNVNMFMAESLVGYKKCKIGDICSNIMWMWHGAVGVTKYDGVISPSYGVYRQRKLYYNGDYLDMLLRLPQLVKFYASRSTGLTESRLRLYPDDFLNIYFFVPPIEEQEMIVKRLKTICEPIESAIDAATQQISLLQERKQIIINDVVTGKVKVS